MKIAISNIAWHPHEEEAIADLMQQFGISGVEIAPTKICASPLEATPSELSEYRLFWRDRGIQIVALQALLYGRPDLTIFESTEQRQETIAYLGKIVELASQLGAGVLVFGSPKNRAVGNLNPQEIAEISLDFFSQVGEIADRHGVKFCIEPNPPHYHCDFINTSDEGLALVKSVARPGFGLHLDAAGMTLSEENIESAIARSISQVCHFHISEPDLAPIGTGGVEHLRFANALRQENYSGWSSIEMKAQKANYNIENVKKAIDLARNYYG